MRRFRARSRCEFALLTAIVSMAASHRAIGQHGEVAPKVDFAYAFATPHRITVGRPDASDRTLLDLQPGSLRMVWTYDNLAMPNYPPLAFRTPPTLWSVQITPQIDGKPLARSRWKRLDALFPSLENVYEDAAGSVRLEAITGVTAALVRVHVANSDSKPHQFVLRCDSGNWGENPAWVDCTQYVGDNLTAGWNARADRVLILGLGADACSLQADGLPPGPRNMILVWNVKPGEKRQGWIVRRIAVTRRICPTCVNTTGPKRQSKAGREKGSGVDIFLLSLSSNNDSRPLFFPMYAWREPWT